MFIFINIIRNSSNLKMLQDLKFCQMKYTYPVKMITIIIELFFKSNLHTDCEDKFRVYEFRSYDFNKKI